MITTVSFHGENLHFSAFPNYSKYTGHLPAAYFKDLLRGLKSHQCLLRKVNTKEEIAVVTDFV